MSTIILVGRGFPDIWIFLDVFPKMHGFEKKIENYWEEIC